MDNNQVFNIAVSCVRASHLDTETKDSVIQELRKYERELDLLRDISDSCVCGDLEAR